MLCLLTVSDSDASSLPPPSPCISGPGSYPCSLLMCHTHRQEPLELFCESCDLLCCSSCHLSSHKNHRLVLNHVAQGHCREGGERDAKGANHRLNTSSELKSSLTALSFLSQASAYTTLGIRTLISYSYLFVFCDIKVHLLSPRSHA